jgi:hypothetical protein
MPSRRVVRLDTQGRETGEPLRCYLANAIVAEPGLLTLEQCLRILLVDGECAEGDSDKRPIRCNGQLVGYIDIADVEPFETASRRSVFSDMGTGPAPATHFVAPHRTRRRNDLEKGS